MIHDSDRSYYIGASDVRFVVGNYKTKTFEAWYRTKQGFSSRDIKTDAILAGTYYEHRILDAINVPELVKDAQIIWGRLRVNLDGCTKDTIYEIKTHKLDKAFKVSKAYWQQVQVQMYATGIRKAYIIAYALTEAEYANYYLDIDKSRISIHPIEYDEKFINKEFLPKFFYLSKCLDEGSFPKTE